MTTFAVYVMLWAGLGDRSPWVGLGLWLLFLVARYPAPALWALFMMAFWTGLAGAIFLLLLADSSRPGPVGNLG